LVLVAMTLIERRAKGRYADASETYTGSTETEVEPDLTVPHGPASIDAQQVVQHKEGV
ncbi:sulfate ABC transporter, partial [Streptomyces sp. SID10244]|nr:sulfate ABC transporter [Streptomyces sp. SID10244]